MTGKKLDSLDKLDAQPGYHSEMSLWHRRIIISSTYELPSSSQELVGLFEKKLSVSRSRKAQSKTP